jgi:hypothetical protein
MSMLFSYPSSFVRRRVTTVMLASVLSVVSVVPALAISQVMPSKKSKGSENAEPKQKGSGKKSKKSDAARGAPASPATRMAPVGAIPFGETNGREPINASGVVAVGDGLFLFCDNKTSDALYELHIDASGRKTGSLVRRPINVAGGVGDMEGLALVETESQRFVVATSSFGLRASKGKKSGGGGSSSEGLLRVDIGTDGSLSGRKMTGVRDWLVSHYPELRATASFDPDRGGLNLEGLAWDPTRGALLFGVRTPLAGGMPLILPVRLDISAPWTVEALEALPAIRLALQPSAQQGIRSIEYDGTRKVFWVSVGRAVSGGAAPFEMYSWDGNQEGTVRQLRSLVFDDAMKVEGIVAGTVGGKDAVLLLDDGGGYQVVWADDPRLQ